MLPEFIEFLETGNALDSFVKNLKEAHGAPGAVHGYFLFWNVREEDLVSFGFTWDNTKEGPEFWASLSLRWREKHKELRNW